MNSIYYFFSLGLISVTLCQNSRSVNLDDRGWQRRPPLRPFIDPDFISEAVQGDVFEAISDETAIEANKEVCETAEDKHCKEICLKYTAHNAKPVYCTRRQKDTFIGWVSKKVYYYWTIRSCLTHQMAQEACEQGGGIIAPFKDGSDRVFATSYMTGLMNTGAYCFNDGNGASPNLNLFWAGLTATSETAEWVWSDGSAVSKLAPIAWNKDLQYYYKTRMYRRKLLGKQCALVGWTGVVWEPTEYSEGFDRVDCRFLARTICVKEVPSYQ